MKDYAIIAENLNIVCVEGKVGYTVGRVCNIFDCKEWIFDIFDCQFYSVGSHRFRHSLER